MFAAMPFQCLTANNNIWVTSRSQRINGTRGKSGTNGASVTELCVRLKITHPKKLMHVTSTNESAVRLCKDNLYRTEYTSIPQFAGDTVILKECRPAKWLEPSFISPKKVTFANHD